MESSFRHLNWDQISSLPMPSLVQKVIGFSQGSLISNFTDITEVVVEL